MVTVYEESPNLVVKVVTGVQQWELPGMLRSFLTDTPSCGPSAAVGTNTSSSMLQRNVLRAEYIEYIKSLARPCCSVILGSTVGSMANRSVHSIPCERYGITITGFIQKNWIRCITNLHHPYCVLILPTYS